jgi:hypothetical protein
VIAEISSEDTPVDVESFWTADSARFGRTLDTFSRIGVRMVIADTVPDPRSHPGWSPLGATGYSAYVHAWSRKEPADDGPS